MSVSFDSTIQMAASALGRHRVRSLLTMLGVIIGVAAVIFVVSVGQGADAVVQSEIAAMGSNILYVWPGSMRTMGMRGGAGTITTLTAEDLEAIDEECPAVALTSPSVRSRASVVFGNQNWNTSVEGANEHFPRIRNWPVTIGGFFGESEVRTGARVAVLGRTVANQLFAGIDPIGQTIRINNLPFQVLGVLAAKGQNQWGRDQDDTLLLPYTTVQRKLRAINFLDGAILSAVSSADTLAAEQQVTELLRQRHRITPDREDDFFVRNMTEFAEAAKTTQRTMTLFLVILACVSLVVGGIGIMNIMLVSVTERTREIGLRVAVGARRGQVKLQFLLESIMLSSAGGVLGIVAGIAVSFLFTRTLNWPMLISPAAIAVSVFFSGGVGMVFGYYPARKAASLDPIEALRYE